MGYMNRKQKSIFLCGGKEEIMQEKIPTEQTVKTAIP